MQNNTNGINDKRLILVVEDEAVNRAILGSVLEKDYEVIYAGDGTEALRMASENKTVLSLIILDLIMPGMQGQEVLRRVRADSEYQDIPVIVASGDQSQEIECLNAGASDFIQKPYPEHGVILARVRRTIELFEGRKIIHSTERDPLTGLYNREFFFSYAEQYDQHHRDTPMDAIVLDINRFGIINERYGRAYADEVLRRVGEKAREMVHDEGGIVCRREADIFLVYTRRYWITPLWAWRGNRTPTTGCGCAWACIPMWINPLSLSVASTGPRLPPIPYETALPAISVSLMTRCTRPRCIRSS